MSVWKPKKRRRRKNFEKKTFFAFDFENFQKQKGPPLLFSATQALMGEGQGRRQDFGLGWAIPIVDLFFGRQKKLKNAPQARKF